MATGNDLILQYIFMFSEEVSFGPIGRIPPLGRLGFKTEAAGKVRVFAMVDPITNWLMKPLHDRLFNYLKGIPQDGTFDQLAPVKLLQEKGFKSFYCYDLSAATDRLPISLQVMLLRPILGEVAEV